MSACHDCPKLREVTAQDFFRGLGSLGTFVFLIGNAVRLSKGWARRDANLVMQTGS